MKSVSNLSRRFRVVFDDAKTVPNSGMVIPLRLADRLGVVDGLDRRVGGTGRRANPNGGVKALNLVAVLVAGGEFLSDAAVLVAGSTLPRLGYRRFSESQLGKWLRSLAEGDIDGFADTLTEATTAAWSQRLGPSLDRASGDPCLAPPPPPAGEAKNHGRCCAPPPLA